MIVGDGKQAIYRWRNGKAEQFVNLPKLSGNQPPERRQALEYAYEKGELKKNFRSARTIIRYNNELFASIVEQNDDGKSSIAKVYEGQGQEEVRDIEGYVNVTINEFKKEETNPTNEIKITHLYSERIFFFFITRADSLTDKNII